MAFVLFWALYSGATTAPKTPGTQSNPQGTSNVASDGGRAEQGEMTIPPGDVRIEGRHVLQVYEQIAGVSPQERADRIAERILNVARESMVSPEAIGIETYAEWTEIRAADKVLMVVTEGDARLAGKKRERLAAEDAANIRQEILNYRRDHSWESIFKGIAYSVLATALLVPLLWLFRKFRLALRAKVDRWIVQRQSAQANNTTLNIAFTYAVSLLMALGAILRWLLLIAIVQAYVTLVTRFSPYTRAISLAMSAWLSAALVSLVKSGLGYLPDLFVIAVILTVASQVLKLITKIFDEIGNGNLAFRGFYPDWAEPTAKLVRGLMIVLVVVIIFPYLPGAKSPVFQGISIFVGVLISLGSSSAVANAIAGIILTYMRSFLVGDWVKIGDTIGEVVEKNILVTRLLTPKQEIITLPNATIMSGPVMNYTREAKNEGVIFHTTVTIGYDAPWQTVHQLLIDAAKKTEYVLHRPEPFVLQTALNDFYVTYELNAYTGTPRQMQFIYSELHENIQDSFNEAGVEICSPHFAALRDGNSIAIPERYVPAGYRSPSFRVHEDPREQVKAAGKSAD